MITNNAGRPRTPARPDAKASGLASKEEINHLLQTELLKFNELIDCGNTAEMECIMNNEYQNIIVTAKEDMSWSEANWCWEYANQVVDYCNEHGIDLADASNAESAIVQYNEEQCSFCDQYGYELSDYLGTIVANVGMIVEG